jgi:periplasmic copper chaperone A
VTDPAAPADTSRGRAVTDPAAPADTSRGRAVTDPATPAAPGVLPAPNWPRRAWLRDLLRGVAGPIICAVLLTGLLAAWVTTGGAGTLTRVRLQVTLAAVPMRAFTPRAAAAVGAATTFLTIMNLSGTPDELIAASSPIAGRVILTRRSGPTAPRTVTTDLVVPAHGTLTLSPFGDDLVLQDPAPFETSTAVPLTLTFRHAGTVTIDMPVTAPGTP